MSVVKLNNCEVLIELNQKENVIGVAQEIQKLTSWGRIKCRVYISPAQ